MEKLHQVIPPKALDLENIKATKVLGKGATGTVFLAHDTTTSSAPFALKVVDKTAVSSKTDADRRARWETTVLSSLWPHPFLPSLLGTFECGELIGWAVPYCPGGDLDVHRHHQTDRVFSTAVIRFYLAEIICALGRLHSVGIVYRDLKPENVLIQQSGHLTLTDFDLSRRLTRKSSGLLSDDHPPPLPKPKAARGNSTSGCHKQRQQHWSLQQKRNLTRYLLYGSDQNGLKKTKSTRVTPMTHHRRKTGRSFSAGGDGERSNSFVGTEEYVSPEVLRGDGHEFAVDWWALGILGYEMLYGKTPFRGKNRKESFRNILTKEPEFAGKRSRTGLMDLIERLLEKEPARRLGFYGGAEEIKRHEFFEGLRWDLLTEVLRPPFVPPTDDGEELTSTTAAGGFDVREYFQGLRRESVRQPSAPPSPLASPSSEYQRKISLREFF